MMAVDRDDQAHRQGGHWQRKQPRQFDHRHRSLLLPPDSFRRIVAIREHQSQQLVHLLPLDCPCKISEHNTASWRRAVRTYCSHLRSVADYTIVVEKRDESVLVSPLAAEAKDDEEEHELDAVAAVVVDRLVAAVEHLLVAVVVVVVVVHSSLQFAACYELVYRLATHVAEVVVVVEQTCAVPYVAVQVEHLAIAAIEQLVVVQKVLAFDVAIAALQRLDRRRWDHASAGCTHRAAVQILEATSHHMELLAALDQRQTEA